MLPEPDSPQARSSHRSAASPPARSEPASDTDAPAASGRRQPDAGRVRVHSDRTARLWECRKCGAMTDVNESMGRCHQCGATQWGGYLLLPALGLLLLAGAVAATYLHESAPLIALVGKWVGLTLGVGVSWLGWYIVILDLTKDRAVLVWLLTLVLGAGFVLLGRLL